MNCHGFTLVREEELREAGGRVRLWKHDVTGAELLSICNDDENKSFGVSFRNREGKSVGKPLILSTAGTSEWTKIERDLEIPEGAVRLLLDPVNFGTAGTFEIRGLTFSAR